MPRPVSSRSSRVIAAAAAALLLVSVVPGLAVARASHPVARASAASDPDHDGLDSSFEIHWSLTDPRDPDSNHDGIRDGREDPDGDHLSNVWEQRLGLDPRSADTDGDGNPDGSEDRDHDRLTNRFEVHVTRTDPQRVDSDLDGVRDGAEDPDGDHLSNAGEQRFGTDPLVVDTDGDGIDDWHADSDANGREDGLDQDDRAVPPGLTPALSAPRDTPQSYLDCHQRARHSHPRVCAVGTRGGPRVVLFGDSHALEWRAALEQVAIVRGWRLFVITKSACPVAEITLAASPDCAQWRKLAIARIGKIAPAMVIASNRNQYTASDATDRVDNEQKWQAGLTSSLRALKAPGRQVILLGDTSRFGDPVACLAANPDDIAACSLHRWSAIGVSRIVSDRAAATAAGVGYRRTVDLSCPYDPCPVVIDRMLVAYDEGHMTNAFSRSIWRGLGRLLPRI